jgi:hypothetical protein
MQKMFPTTKWPQPSTQMTQQVQQVVMPNPPKNNMAAASLVPSELPQKAG